MEFSDLKRDASKVLGAFKTVDDVVIAKSGCKIYTPARFITRGLGDIGANTRVFGFFGIVVGDHYAVLNANTMISTRPTSISIITIDGADYYEFSYESGSTFIANRNTVMQDTLVYYIFNELIAKAYIPWFANIEDIAKIYVTAARYAGANILDSNVVIEMMVAQIVRQVGDKTKFFRSVVKDIRHAPKKSYSIVPLRSPIYGANNTTARIMGSHFDDSLMTAINNPSDKLEPIESRLKN